MLKKIIAFSVALKKLKPALAKMKAEILLVRVRTADISA
jgi:hypothetical protein